MNILLKVFFALIVIFKTDGAFSYELDLESKLNATSGEPIYDDTETIKGKGKPIHENLIVASVLKANLPNYTYQEKLNLIKELVIGVRWNDDPLYMFQEHLAVGALSFWHSCEDDISKKINEKWDLFYRSHCGDMQFLHAMASKEYERAKITYAKMISWLEFTYKTATGSMSSDLRFRSVDYRMEPLNAHTFKEIMISKHGGRSMWNADIMFSFDCTRGAVRRDLECSQLNYNKSKIRNIALGSLLHILQDSYSESHTKRNQSGNITTFGVYSTQNKSKHSEKDTEFFSPFKEHLIDISAKIIETVVKDRQLSYKFNETTPLEMDSWSLVQSRYIDSVIRPLDMYSFPNHLGLKK
ncbi:hypothetical protein ACK36D_15535 [Aeromonas veronii]